jgi:hypothetical protein
MNDGYRPFALPVFRTTISTVAAGSCPENDRRDLFCTTRKISKSKNEQRFFLIGATMQRAHRRLNETRIVGERYQIEGYLGEGDAGTVYQCRDLGEGKTRLAMKILRGANPIPSLTASLSQELSFLRRLSHTNLARLLDFGILEDTGELFLVEEFVEGKDLYSGSEGMSPEELLTLLVELCKAIQYLHLQRIVHGSLKPSNAVLVGNGDGRRQLKVLDFGIARWLRNTQFGGGNAMPIYTAPEILLGERPDARSDLYSLGILTYQLLARRLPFGDEDPGFLIQKHLQGSVDLRPIERLSGGSALSQLLRGLLDKSPLRRPASGEIAIKLLGEAVGEDCSGMDVKELETYFSTTRLVGREKEILHLRECANRVRGSGRGWTVFISGEAGAGKTRCMEELRSWALLEGWRVIEGTCGTREEESYAPFRQILARTLPADGEVLFDFSEAPRVSGSGTFEAASDFAAGQFRDLLTRELVRRLMERPTLLLLHDFHRADEATGAVLDYLSSDIQAHPV